MMVFMPVEEIPSAVVFAGVRRSLDPLQPTHRHHLHAIRQVRLGLLGVGPVRIEQKPCRSKSAEVQDHGMQHAA